MNKFLMAALLLGGLGIFWIMKNRPPEPVAMVEPEPEKRKKKKKKGFLKGLGSVAKIATPLVMGAVTGNPAALTQAVPQK